MTQIKETKAQRVERLKHEQNPWHALEQIRSFARNGYDRIPPEWLGLYFRWWGVYSQGDGMGVVGGAGGEGKAVPYFMVRIAIPNGMLTSSQAAAIAAIAERHARGLIDITVRQNLQLHWVSIESLPAVLDAVAAAGLSPRGACGDVVRNITGCPLAGLAADELCDASPLVLEAHHRLRGADEFYNLPRKFKATITGCRHWCSYPEINDVALTAVGRRVHGKAETGFSLRVGGGLSSEPHLAVRLDAFVPWSSAVDVVAAVTEIFREEQSLRESRERARLKYLFLRHGWTAESFLIRLEQKLGRKFDPAPDETPPGDVLRDHTGIYPQKEPGLHYVGASVLRGRLSARQLATAAELAARYGNGELRTTTMQNFVIANVREVDVQRLADGLAAVQLRIQGSPFWRGAIACTGTEFCKLAITETKGFAHWLVERMEERLPEFDQPLKLHVTGCPNSCGQHWIADIGLEGKKLKVNGRMLDAYYFCLGGALGLNEQIARPVGYRCLATEVPDALERLLRGYLAARFCGEDLQSFLFRHSEEQLRALLAGRPSEAVTRDPSPGRTPHEVAG